MKITEKEKETLEVMLEAWRQSIENDDFKPGRYGRRLCMDNGSELVMELHVPPCDCGRKECKP